MYKRIPQLLLLVIFLTAASAIGETAFNLDGKSRFPLNRKLAVGDVITAWGVYHNHETSKFNINIMGPGDVFLLHVDFRPYNNVVVLNNKVQGRWQTEIRPAFSKNNFGFDKIFRVDIIVQKDNYKVLFNGNELSKTFPHRNPISQAEDIAFYGGSNGFKWTALHLPYTPEGPGSPFPAVRNKPYRPDFTLGVGDYVEAWGVFADQTSKFSVNLRKDNDDFMIHVDFRPPPNENKVVLNSLAGHWQTEIRTEMPKFTNGQVFKVKVLCDKDKFVISVDGNALGATFPYRPGFTLDDVTRVELHGGNNGMDWSDLQFHNHEIVNPELKITVTPEKDVVECQKKKKGCQLIFNVVANKGDVNVPVTSKDVKICRLKGQDKISKCKKAACDAPNFCRILKPNKKSAGKYVAVVKLGGKEVVSNPITLNLV